MNNLISNVVYLISEKILTTLIFLASSIVIIRYLGVEDFGKLALFQIYYAIAVTVSEFGIRRVYSSLKNKKREVLVFGEALRIKIISSAFFFVVTLISLYFLKVDNYYYLILLVFIASPLEIYSYHFEANLNNQLLSKIRVSIALFLAILRMLLCWLSVDFIYIIFSFALTNLLINSICAIVCMRKGIRGIVLKNKGHRDIIRSHLFSRSIFFWISVIIVQLNLRTDQFMLSFMAGTASVGIYAGAYKFIEQFMTIPSILAGVFLPHISRQDNIDKNVYLKNLYLYSLLASFFVSLCCVVVAPFVLPLLLGHEFIKSVAVFQILAISLPMLVLVNLSGLYYSINKLERYAFFRNSFGLILSLSFNYLFIKVFGINGAAFSVFVSYFFVAFVVEWMLPITRKNAELKLESVKDIFSLNTYKVILKNVQNKIFKKR